MVAAGGPEKDDKILGTINPVDMLTKHLPVDLLDADRHSLGTEIRGGRSDMAFTLDLVTTEYEYEWAKPEVEGTDDKSG